MAEGDAKGLQSIGVGNLACACGGGSEALRWWRQEHWARRKWEYKRQGEKIVQLSGLRSVRKL